MQNPYNYSNFRNSKFKKIFFLTLNSSPLHAAEIARITGLSKPTVSEILRLLTDYNLIISEVDASGRTSRVFYKPNLTIGYVLGIDVGSSMIHAGVQNIKGEILGVLDLPLKDHQPSVLIQSITSCATLLLEKLKLDTNQMISLVVGTPGVVDPITGRISIAGTIDYLDGLPMIDILEQHFGISPIIMNDINLSAIAERDLGEGIEYDDFAVLSIGNGLGAGLVIGKELYTGKNGAAGEVFYLPLKNGKDPHRNATNPTFNGLKDILEISKGKVDVDEVIKKALAGNQKEMVAFDELIERIALYIASTSAVLDLEAVILSGGIGKKLTPFVSLLTKKVSTYLPYIPQIKISNLSGSPVLLGALQIGLGRSREILFNEKFTFSPDFENEMEK